MGIAHRILGAGIAAAIHFAATCSAGVLAFLTQGSFDAPVHQSLGHRLASRAADVLEFPLVWAVRQLDPERLSGFLAAAGCNSLLWGIALYFAGAAIIRAARARSPARPA